MKRIKPNATTHTSMNDKLKCILNKCDHYGVRINFKLSDRLQERGLTVRKTAEMTGLRGATISDLCTGRKGSVNLQHILLLMIALRITDIRELIDIEFPENWVNDSKQDTYEWINKKEPPSFSMFLAQCVNSEKCLDCVFDLIDNNDKYKEEGEDEKMKINKELQEENINLKDYTEALIGTVEDLKKGLRTIVQSNNIEEIHKLASQMLSEFADGEEFQNKKDELEHPMKEYIMLSKS